MGALPGPTQVSINSSKSLQDFRNGFQQVTATLVAGEVTISAGIVITADSTILVSRNTEAGTPGHLECPDATRVVGAEGTGEIVIGSSEAADVSTLDILIVG